MAGCDSSGRERESAPCPRHHTQPCPPFAERRSCDILCDVKGVRGCGSCDYVIFDIGGRHPALAIGRKPIERKADGRTSGNHVEKVVERGAGDSRKDPGTYAFLRIWTQPKSPSFKSVVRICEMRYVCDSHVACLIFVFTERCLAMPG